MKLFVKVSILVKIKNFIFQYINVRMRNFFLRLSKPNRLVSTYTMPQRPTMQNFIEINLKL